MVLYFFKPFITNVTLSLSYIFYSGLIENKTTMPTIKPCILLYYNKSVSHVNTFCYDYGYSL